MKFVPHLDCDPLFGQPTDERWSITLNSEKGGWKTDSAYEGYGLSLKLAQWMCDVLNEKIHECPFTMDQWGYWKEKK